MSGVVKDAFWQILGRIASAIGGFLVIKIMTPYLGPIRFGDYSTILKYFAIWSALADFGIYVIALRELGKFKCQYKQQKNDNTPSSMAETSIGDEMNMCFDEIPGQETKNHGDLSTYYSKFVTSRFFMIVCIYTLALIIAYCIPSYTSNPYLVRGLPIGMLFSASFMGAGILQLPLQLYWKMEQVSIGLIVARIVQLIILVCSIYVRFPNQDFENTNAITPFLWVIGSVLASGITQSVYVYLKSRDYLKLSWIWDRSFTKSIIVNNRKYGLAYYLSSFHTLIVLILLSIFFPTIKQYQFVGIRALSLSLLEILLIIPSSLGNSLIHKLSHQDIQTKIKSLSALMHIVIRIAVIITINFYRFATPIIQFVGGTKFLSTTSNIGSDTILSFFGIVLILSFIKQVFNYIFVSTHIQNKLLQSNCFGVVLGIIIGTPLIYLYNLKGAIITQILLEGGFFVGARRIAKQYNYLPKISPKFLLSLVGLISVSLLMPYLFPNIFVYQGRQRIIVVIVCNTLIVSGYYKYLKNIAISL